MGAWPVGLGGVASPLGAFGEFHVDAFAIDVEGGVEGLQHLQQLGGLLGGGDTHGGLRWGMAAGG